MTLTKRGSPVRVPISSVVPGNSPRVGGEIVEHIRTLAEVEAPLPPILIHRSTRQVIDGMHRLRAAIMRGDETIAVEYFDGDEAEGFVAAVQANITHGLPLSLADREAAAARLVTLFAERSDRWIASIAGLSPRTVSVIRTRAGAAHGGPRIGRDGRVRPLSTAEGRRVASELIAKRPDASLREVGRLAGLSPATVRDVRERMRLGIHPVPEHQRVAGSPDPVAGSERYRPARSPTGRGGRDVRALLRILNDDPTLRFSETGRSLLRWLSIQAEGTVAWRRLVDGIPPHCAYVIAEFAAGCADEWSAFAAHLEQRLKETA